jgi:L-lactate dehydrogenase complex protein LldG
MDAQPEPQDARRAELPRLVEEEPVSDARSEVLERVALAISDGSQPTAVPRAYRRAGSLGLDERVALFVERVGEYRADVHRVNADEIAATVETVGAGRLAVAPGAPAAWRPAGVELVEDTGLTAAELDRVDGALTGCTAAVAETGTIVLTAQPHEGRRALTLVPDLHICVVRETQVVELLPEAIDALRGAESRPITFVSGPSATSDIELSRVEGVHGPRTLVVLVVKEAAA